MSRDHRGRGEGDSAGIGEARGPAGKLPVSSITLVEDDPAASRQFELYRNLMSFSLAAVMRTNSVTPLKASISAGTLIPPFCLDPFQPLSAPTPSQDVAEQLDRGRSMIFKFLILNPLTGCPR